MDRFAALKQAIAGEDDETNEETWQLDDPNVSMPRLHITGHRKHFARSTLEQTQSTPLARLHIGKANTDCHLVGRIVSSPVVEQHVQQSVIADERGWRVTVRLYRDRTVYFEGARIAILEPRLRWAKDVYFVRVDSPSDIVWLPGPSVKTRNEGNKLFSDRQYAQAESAYRAALLATPDELEVALCRLNRSECLLQLNRSAAALSEARLAEHCARLTSTQRLKAQLRASKAANELGRYDEVTHMDVSKRRREREGRFDWRAIMDEPDRHAAEFTHADLEVRQTADRGRGVFARQSIAVGQTLMVARPLAIGRPSDERPALNLAQEAEETTAQTDLVTALVQRAIDDPDCSSWLDQLYAGESFDLPAGHDLLLSGQRRAGRRTFDVGRIEGIAAKNAFTVGDRTSRSALYLAPSLVNHDCIGNAITTFFGTTLVLRASRAIEAGEEIMTSYVDPMEEIEGRHRALAAHIGRCDCARCTGERRGDPQRRDELAQRPAPSTPDSLRAHIEAINETYAPEWPLRTSLIGPLLAQMQQVPGDRRRIAQTALDWLRNPGDSMPTILNGDSLLLCAELDKDLALAVGRLIVAPAFNEDDLVQFEARAS